ncbi:MAG: tRNA (guanosine(37)-N1)-methyltransferase TrmD [Pseudomonadales bacterium]|nr:tRNA (guanosine(37)-N1)-methyltransferase TrmD [Pseudomonadales bacterium]
MTITIITLFPEYFKKPLSLSIVGRAFAQPEHTLKIVDLRQFGIGTHQRVDDTPYGGGAGMVMMVEPIEKALRSIGVAKNQEKSSILLTSAKGERYTQKTAREYAGLEYLTIICGHYEGVDERVAEHLVDQEVRIGDFVLSGGEAAALSIVDSVMRLQEGVLGNPESLNQESHDTSGFLAAPQYTKPETYNNWSVPKVLLSGNHGKIAEWRIKSSSD